MPLCGLPKEGGPSSSTAVEGGLCAPDSPVNKLESRGSWMRPSISHTGMGKPGRQGHQGLGRQGMAPKQVATRETYPTMVCKELEVARSQPPELLKLQPRPKPLDQLMCQLLQAPLAQNQVISETYSLPPKSRNHPLIEAVPRGVANLESGVKNKGGALCV